MVMQFATTSNSGTGKSPGGSPTSTQVPRLRVMPTPCLKAPSEGAVISTPCAPPPVPFFTAVAGVAVLGVDDEIGAELFGVAQACRRRCRRRRPEAP